ncbi:MAG TPA: ATP-binding protein [Chthoniobacter sp.]|nr:ATP-binding protein [Chthoniobacter sp.]
MSAVLDRIPGGFLTFTDDGHIKAANATLCAMLGYEPEELVGAHVQVLLSAGGRVFYQTHLFPLLKMHGAVEEIYISLRAKAGDEVPFLINGRREAVDTGYESACLLMRMRQRAHFERDLLDAKKIAQQANRAKDEFLAALSHELRTPLNPVLMLSTAMELDATVTPEVREQAGIIRRNAELEARLIDDLLDHTRIKHGKLRLVLGPLDLHALLNHSEEIVRSEGAGKRVAITFEKNALRHHVHGDSARLQQVFWNVIKNGVKFTPAGGRVHVTTSNDADGNLVVTVADTGIGIPLEALPRVFNTFDQGSVSTRTFGGLGLGLAISQGIISMHEGSIRAESEGGGKGTTFFITLKTIAAPSHATATPVPEQKKAQGRLRLLLVEDHQSTREVLGTILRRKGYEVHDAATGEAALEAARTVPSIDVLLCDLGLPDTTGFDLIPQIQQLHPRITGIALSGYGMEEDLQRAKAAGFAAHLVKPIPFEQLRALLEQLA